MLKGTASISSIDLSAPVLSVLAPAFFTGSVFDVSASASGSAAFYLIKVFILKLMNRSVFYFTNSAKLFSFVAQGLVKWCS